MQRHGNEFTRHKGFTAFAQSATQMMHTCIKGLFMLRTMMSKKCNVAKKRKLSLELWASFLWTRRIQSNHRSFCTHGTCQTRAVVFLINLKAHINNTLSRSPRRLYHSRSRCFPQSITNPIGGGCDASPDSRSKSFETVVHLTPHRRKT